MGKPTKQTRPRLVTYLDDPIKDWWEATARQMGCKPSTITSQLLTAIANANINPLALLGMCMTDGVAAVPQRAPLSTAIAQAPSFGQLVAAGTAEPLAGTASAPPNTSTLPLLCSSTPKKIEERRGAPLHTTESPTGNWATLAQALIVSYPHGWGEDRIIRKPQPLDVEAALGEIVRSGYLDGDAILDGAHQLAAARPGDLARFSVGLVKWLDPSKRLWLDSLEKAPEVVAPPQDPDLLAALHVLADEAGRDTYRGHEKHAEILEEFRAQLFEGRPLTKPQGQLTATIAKRVGAGCKPSQTPNCPPRRPSPSEQRGLDAAAYVAKLFAPAPAEKVGRHREKYIPPPGLGDAIASVGKATT